MSATERFANSNPNTWTGTPWIASRTAFRRRPLGRSGGRSALAVGLSAWARPPHGRGDDRPAGTRRDEPARASRQSNPLHLSALPLPGSGRPGHQLPLPPDAGDETSPPPAAAVSTNSTGSIGRHSPTTTSFTRTGMPCSRSGPRGRATAAEDRDLALDYAALVPGGVPSRDGAPAGLAGLQARG